MRKEKELLLNEIKSKIEAAKAFIVTRYERVSATDMTQFRKDISNAGSDFEVMGKRMFIKAAEAQGLEFKKETLQGHIGIVIIEDDYISAAKEVHKYTKDSEKMEIIAGYIEGELYDKESVIKLSQLPNLEEMRAQFIGTLEAPMAETVGVFDSLLKSIIYCLENKAKQ